jgi:hypothetical protein
MRLTVTLDWPEPPAPVQTRVNVVALASAAVLSLPAVALAPLQPPDAVHDVAFAEVQVNVLLPPLATLVGDADKETVGVGVDAVTETVLLACALPPAPLQLSVKLVVVVSAPVLWEPDVALPPLQPPDAVQEVALVEDQVSVLLLPLLMLVGDADSETVGVAALTETVALVCAVPPDPVQLKV